MKKVTVLIAALFALAAPVSSFAASHEGHDHGSMDMSHGDHSMMEKGDVAHQEVVDGVKAVFKVLSMKEHMKVMKMEMPKDVKETHHIMVEFKVKVQGPDKVEQTKDLMGMQGHFGADFDLSKKGKYGVMAKFQLKDGKV